MTSKVPVIPSLAPFPEAAWREQLVPTEWQACLDAWIGITSAHLSLSSSHFAQVSRKDESLPEFLISYVAALTENHEAIPAKNSDKPQLLRKQCFLLSYRLLDFDPPPGPLLDWEFLANLSKLYGQRQGGKLLSAAWKRSTSAVEDSLGKIKTYLTMNLEAGLKGDLKSVESQLKRLNHLLHASPEVAAFFLAGDDFMDSLISCYKLMNPPLRKIIISTTYLCLIGLTEGGKPKFSSLVDQLYSLKSAADIHKAGPTNVNDSLVAELVTATPILKQVQQRIEASGSGSSRAKSVLAALDGFKKAGGHQRPPRLIKRKIDKGKGIAQDDDFEQDSNSQIHVHRMSLISQVQDLFPDLGSGFIVKLLDEYDDNVELVISHLLEDSLPSHLQGADRSEELKSPLQPSGDLAPGMAPHSTPPQLPTRRNVFDDDEFDQLTMDTSRLHFGRRNPNQTADDVLDDKSTAPNKAAILSALAAFDSDDDERDDTYDVEDVGGTVDSAAPGNNPEEVNLDVRDGQDEALFRAYKSTPDVFNRDAATRRGKARMVLKESTGMTDESIEGWGLMLSRDPRQMRRLDAKFSSFSGEQKTLAPTAWRASPAGSGTEDSDIDGNNRGRGGLRGGRGRGRGRGGGRGGNVAGPTGDKETEVARNRKEANKGSRANHNRRDQRAKKMARGGFPG
ncbi:hypothetical protein B0J14DRAFT_343998 [Halenospora varia]|nr:hypothetical protein B0J14DRAFT_343998 [Halenospora varia]